MKVYNKMKWALGILLVFIIVLITNLYTEGVWCANSFAFDHSMSFRF
jgi:hypothetical protein